MISSYKMNPRSVAAANNPTWIRINFITAWSKPPCWFLAPLCCIKSKSAVSMKKSKTAVRRIIRILLAHVKFPNSKVSR